MNGEEDARPDAELDPQEFLRRMLHISPEDAETVRERTSPTRKRPQPDDDELVTE